MKKSLLLLPAAVVVGHSIPLASAQVVDFPAQQPAPAQAAPAANGGGNGGGGSPTSFLGRDMPMFDPGTETIQWDGRTWNINNNRLFEARFERFLSAPEETEEQDRLYNSILFQILEKLSPNRVDARSLDEAFSLLPKASEFRRDAGLCDTIANQVYSAWMARQNMDRLRQADTALEEDRRRLERNQRIAAEGSSLSTNAPRDAAAAAEWAKQQQLQRDVTMQPFATRLTEVNALLTTNKAKRELQELQTKIEFQALIVQLFMQRRFQHVLIATRFYRNVFGDGDNRLRVDGEAKNIFANTTGMPPTVGTLDAMASEMIRDVSEGIEAFKFLLERDELESATKRLAETFVVGEYLPQVRTLERDKKRQALGFVQASNKLISALEVKDYALAEQLVRQLEESAKDFDNSKPLAAIETAKTVAAMHIAKAKNAAVSGDRESLETELAAATVIWPRNPDLAEVSKMIFSQADVQNRALVDFDQLLSQRNHRQIFDDKERFIAATALDAQRQEQLREVLTQMTEIEGAIIRANEIERRGDFAGAWESAERAYQRFPDDSKLNQIRASLTTKAADFVGSLRRAEELEQRGQAGSSLAWFLRAQQQYPNSDIARAGIERLTKRILPDAT